MHHAIHQFKYGDSRALDNTLALFPRQHLKDRKLEADLLIAVPLHRDRLKRRDYHQSQLLVRRLV